MIKLLPMIRTDGCELSLQHPITLNGSLVSDIEETEYTYIIHNMRGETKRFDKNNLQYTATTAFNSYIENFGITYCDEYGRHYLAYNDFHSYIRYLKTRQIRNMCSSDCHHFTLDCYRQLYNQHRISAREWNEQQEYYRRNYHISIAGRYDQNEGLWNREYINTANTERVQERRSHPASYTNERAVDWEFYHDFRNIHTIYTDEHDNISHMHQYIHTYNYIPPKYIKHYMKDEDPFTTLLFGVEIEVGGNKSMPTRDEKNEHVKKCIQIINGSESTEEDLIYSTSDSTVQIELDTMPCSLEYHKQKMNYNKLFKYLDKTGYKGHDCETAGLHIHANRDYLGSSKLVQQLNISKILYILEKFNDEVCVIARRNCNYSPFVGNNEDSAVELYGKYNNAGKHVALNLKHKDTIEFRMFKSTLKYETFILALEFVKSIIDFAKSVNIEEIEMITWQDLMQHSSPTVREYYKQRKELEEKKMQEQMQEHDKEITQKVIDMLKKTISRLNKESKHCSDYLKKNSIQKELNDKQLLLKEILGGKHNMQFINTYYEKFKPQESLTLTTTNNSPNVNIPSFNVVSSETSIWGGAPFNRGTLFYTSSSDPHRIRENHYYTM